GSGGHHGRCGRGVVDGERVRARAGAGVARRVGGGGGEAVAAVRQRRRGEGEDAGGRGLGRAADELPVLIDLHRRSGLRRDGQRRRAVVGQEMGGGVWGVGKGGGDRRCRRGVGNRGRERARARGDVARRVRGGGGGRGDGCG